VWCLRARARADGMSRSTYIYGSNEQNSPNLEASGNVNEARRSDIDLITELRINTIFDFMVEEGRSIFGIGICSSEKSDQRRRYESFEICGVPYPGVEFFSEFRSDQNVCPEWEKHGPKAEMQLSSPAFDADWDDFRSWGIAELTGNYVKLLLASLRSEKCDGILVHCISGWDRTPLFVSLLRLSLWADGLVHESLTAEEIFFLTVAYDWYLFGFVSTLCALCALCSVFCAVHSALSALSALVC
jgi:myotubularin-related protein 14